MRDRLALERDQARTSSGLFDGRAYTRAPDEGLFAAEPAAVSGCEEGCQHARGHPGPCEVLEPRPFVPAERDPADRRGGEGE